MGKNEYNNDIVCLLEYFYICGIREPRTNKINSLKCLSPEVLYSTCANENKEMIDENELMTSKKLDMIFPQSNTFFTKLIIGKKDSNYFYSRPFEDQVKEIVLDQEIPKPTFHCFSQIIDSKVLYYNCLLYWRKIKYNNIEAYSDLGNNKTIIIVREAFVILSSQPCFSFFNKLLLSIYNKYKDSDKKEEELTKLFDVLFLELKVDITKINDITIFPLLYSYSLYYKPFFPLCDINIGMFFKVFTPEQFLFLLLLNLNRDDYLVVSNDYQIFYPLYYITKIFLHPLDNPEKTNDYHFSLFYGMTVSDSISYLQSRGQIAMFMYSSQVQIKEQLKKVVRFRAKNNLDGNNPPKPLYLITIKDMKAKINELKATKFNSEIVIAERVEPYIFFHMIINNSNLLKIYNNIKKTIEKFSSENNNESFFSYDDNKYKEIELFQYQMFNYMTNFFCYLKIEAKPKINGEESKDKKVVVDILDIKIDYKFNSSLIRTDYSQYISNLLIYCLPDITHVTDDHVDNDSRLLMELLNLQRKKLLPSVLNFKPLLQMKYKIEIHTQNNKEIVLNNKKVLSQGAQWLNYDYNIFRFLYEQKLISLEKEKEEHKEVFFLGILYTFISIILILNNASLLCPIQSLYKQMIIFIEKTNIYHGKFTIFLSCLYYIHHVLYPSLKELYHRTLNEDFKKKVLDTVLLGIIVKNKENKLEEKIPTNNNNQYLVYKFKDEKHEIYDYKTIVFDKENFIFKCPTCQRELTLEVKTEKENRVLIIKKPSSFFDKLFNLLLSRSTLFFDVTNGEHLFTQEEYNDWINDYYLIMTLSQESFPFFN